MKNDHITLCCIYRGSGYEK